MMGDNFPPAPTEGDEIETVKQSILRGLAPEVRDAIGEIVNVEKHKMNEQNQLFRQQWEAVNLERFRSMEQENQFLKEERELLLKTLEADAQRNETDEMEHSGSSHSRKPQVTRLKPHIFI